MRRLSTRKVPSILELESNLDFMVNGQMVSSWRVNVVRSSFSTNLLEIRLIEDPESRRQRACEAVPSILTKIVGKSITLFWRKIEVSKDELDVEGVKFERIELLAGDGDRDRDDDGLDSFMSFG